MTTKPYLVMTGRCQVLGHYLNKGDALTIVDEPTAPGEVDAGTAKLLESRKLACAPEDLRPTTEAPLTDAEIAAAKAAEKAAEQPKAPVTTPDAGKEPEGDKGQDTTPTPAPKPTTKKTTAEKAG